MKELDLRLEKVDNVNENYVFAENVLCNLSKINVKIDDDWIFDNRYNSHSIRSILRHTEMIQFFGESGHIAVDARLYRPLVSNRGLTTALRHISAVIDSAFGNQLKCIVLDCFHICKYESLTDVTNFLTILKEYAAKRDELISNSIDIGGDKQGASLFLNFTIRMDDEKSIDIDNEKFAYLICEYHKLLKVIDNLAELCWLWVVIEIQHSRVKGVFYQYREAILAKLNQANKYANGYCTALENAFYCDRGNRFFIGDAACAFVD